MLTKLLFNDSYSIHIVSLFNFFEKKKKLTQERRRKEEKGHPPLILTFFLTIESNK